MFVTTHLAAGLIIGKITNDYPTALIGSMLIDIDHFWPLIKYKFILSLRKSWKVISDDKYSYYNFRNYLHSLFAWFILSLILIFINLKIGFIFSISFLIHLFLDSLNDIEFYPFYPLDYHVKGWIKQFSKTELLLNFLLFAIFFII